MPLGDLGSTLRQDMQLWHYQLWVDTPFKASASIEHCAGMSRSFFNSCFAYCACQRVIKCSLSRKM
eukprot:4774081-Amphidinium_carterae.2